MRRFSILAGVGDVFTFRVAFLLLRIEFMHSSLSQTGSRFYPPFASIAKGEVFVLLYVFLFFCLFGQRFLDNPWADSRQCSHAGVLWFRMCLLPFWGLAAPGGRKKGQIKFLLLWSQWGIFCILAVFERYLSNACTDPPQILFI